jgi:hypothetical protein
MPIDRWKYPANFTRNEFLDAVATLVERMPEDPVDDDDDAAYELLRLSLLVAGRCAAKGEDHCRKLTTLLHIFAQRTGLNIDPEDN